MKIINRVKIASALFSVCLSGIVLADESASLQQNDWSPFSSYDSSLGIADEPAGSSNSRLVPMYSDSFGSDFLDQYNSNALSFGIEDSSDGLWKFSLDVNQSHATLFSEDQYVLNTAYSPDGDSSTFYINYGNRRVPVSIKVDEFLNYNSADYSGSDLALGFEQKLNDSWAVSISYTKSELEQKGADTNLFGFSQSTPTNQQYWFDLNSDGLPEAVNLFSDLGVSGNFDKAYEGIEIRLTRQVSEQLSFGGSLSKNQSDFDWKPFQFNQPESSASALDEAKLSLFGQLDVSSQWSLGAEVSHKQYQQQSPQIVSLVSDNANSLDFDNTTLDIGVKYQGRWDDMGLVIRIDLVNLLGAQSDQAGSQNLNDTGLAPYIFETPKYIKLSGSINF